MMAERRRYRDRAVVSKIVHQQVAEAPSSMPRGVWWEELDTDFAKRAERFTLALSDRVKVGAMVATDVALRTSAAAALSALALPVGYRPLRLRKDLADRSVYEPLALSRDPTRFFRKPEGAPPVRIRRRTRGAFKPPRSECEDLKFESRYEPFNPRLASSYGKTKANRFVHVRYWRHRHGPRPTLIAIHGFTAERYALNQWLFALPWVYERLGMDVALFNLPFHGKRAGPLSPFSGHGFFAHGPSHLNEAFGQGVHDFRSLLNYLQESRGVETVGVTGISLGGFTSALLAATEPRLAFSIPNVPVVSLADLLLEWQPLGIVMNTLLKGVKRSIVDARRMLAVSTPLTYDPVIDKKRLMVIGGVGDRFAPPKHSRLLWDHWGRCRIHWFPGSHMVHLDRGEYLHQIGRFFADIGVATPR